MLYGVLTSEELVNIQIRRDIAYVEAFAADGIDSEIQAHYRLIVSVRDTIGMHTHALNCFLSEGKRACH